MTMTDPLPSTDGLHESDDPVVAAIGRMPSVQTILRVLATTTHRRIALIARVTKTTWTACAVLDDAGFGLRPGDHLDVETTY